jgi:hypothetical protein
MRLVRFLLCDLPIALTLAFFLLAFSANSAAAKDLPSDVCSLISPQQLQKMLGQPYSLTDKAAAPPAYRGQAAGTTCRYEDKSGRHAVVLIVYADKSPAEAKETFDKLSAWFPADSKPSGIGDSAYMDKNHAIHVLKGNVRYFINVGSGDSAAAEEKEAQDLAISVAAQI